MMGEGRGESGNLFRLPQTTQTVHIYIIFRGGEEGRHRDCDAEVQLQPAVVRAAVREQPGAGRDQ